MSVRGDDPREELILAALSEWVGSGIDGYTDVEEALTALSSLVSDLAEARKERDEARDLVRGGNCVRDETGKSPCEAAEAEVERLTRVRDALQQAVDATPGITSELRERAEAAEARLADATAALRSIADSVSATASGHTPDDDLRFEPTYGFAVSHVARVFLDGLAAGDTE